jgi:hypothetical protein
MGSLIWEDARSVQAEQTFSMEGGTPLIQHQSYANYFVVTCDKCGRLDSVSTVKTATQAKQIANTSFSWEMDTPLGDLCRRCAWEWRDGSPDKGGAGPLIM